MRHLRTVMALTAGLIGVVVFVGLTLQDRFVVLEDHRGQRLPVPKQYVAEFSSLVRAFVPDIDGAYDTDEGELAVSLPEALFSQRIPNFPERGHDVRMLLYLPEPGVNYGEHIRARISEIIERKGKWSDPRWEVDPSTHLVRVHNGDFREMYDVLRIEPEADVAVFSSDDWVAGCVAIGMGADSMCLMQFTADGINVEMWTPYEALPVRDEIRNVLADEISSWRLQHDRNGA
jgi:hypothetical protein